MSMKRGLWAVVILFILPLLAACTIQMAAPTELGDEEMAMVETEAAAKGITAEQLLTLAQLKDQGPAPELFNETWLNTEGEEALQLADLRGNVVIVEFWTYG